MINVEGLGNLLGNVKTSSVIKTKDVLNDELSLIESSVEPF